MRPQIWLFALTIALSYGMACGTGEESPPPATSDIGSDGATSETTWESPIGTQIILIGEIGLGEGGQAEVDVMPQNAAFIGIGITDATLCGDGRTSGCNAACPSPCIAPGYPAGCGSCPSRGTYDGSIITANLTINNTTGAGTYGSCSLQDMSVCTSDSTNECIPSGSADACNGHPVTNVGTQANTDPYLSPFDTIPAGIMAGLCKNGTTACAAAQSDGGGNNIACGGAGTCSDNGAACGAGPNGVFGNADDVKSLCGNPVTASCAAPGTLIGDGKCWSGCGTCTPGRPFNCAEFLYAGSNAGGAFGDIKCTGTPYSMVNPDISPDTLVIGTVAQGGSASFTFELNATDNLYCLQRFLIRDDPYGDLGGFGCTATCGDGVIASLNGETCEMKYDPTDLVPPYRMVGCLDGAEICQGCNSCIAP